MCGVVDFVSTLLSLSLSLILLPSFTVDAEASLIGVQNPICDTSYDQKGDGNSTTIKLIGQVLHCNSREPIKWILQIRNGTHDLRAPKNEVVLPFESETKLATCDSWKSPATDLEFPDLALATPSALQKRNISYYFTSNLTFTNMSQWSITKDIDIFCATFTPLTNSTTFPSTCIKAHASGHFGYCENGLSSIRPASPNTNAKPVDCGELVLAQDNSTGKCGCEKTNEHRKNDPPPRFLFCKDLMSCRIFAEAKRESLCEATRVQNLCSETSFSLSSKTQGGLLYCQSNVRAPYVSFFSTPQQPNSDSVTNNKPDGKLTKIQILGNFTQNYEPFLELSLLDPGNESEITWKTGASIKCRGPAFIFLEGFHWTLKFKDNKTSSDLLPTFSVLDSQTETLEDGQKYVSSTLRILPDARNQSVSAVVNLAVICSGFVKDRNFLVHSTRTVNNFLTPTPNKENCEQVVTGNYCTEILGFGTSTTTENSTSTIASTSSGTLSTDSTNIEQTTATITSTSPPTSTSFPTTTKNITVTQTETTETSTSSSAAATTTPSRNSPENPNGSGQTQTPNIISSSTDGTTEKPNAGESGIGALNLPIIIIIAVSGSFGVCLLIFVPCVIILMRKNRKQKHRLKMSDEEINDFLQGNDSVHLIPYDTTLEIPREQLIIGAKVLGSGAFGKVLEGKYGEKRVAIKTVNKSADMQYFKALLSEIKIMGFVGKHENVVELIGACTRDIKTRNVYVVFELCENGNLVQFLRKNRDNFENEQPKQGNQLNVNQRMSMVSMASTKSKRGRKLTSQDLVRWSLEIACGMDIIAQKKIYHGDLAARNILLDGNLVAKVGDFGLSRQLFEYSVYVQKTACPLPLKWMSIESLRDLEFSIQSDVWSFGITLWEIFSLGCQPYPNAEWNFESWKNLLEGERMEKPDQASNSIYEIMLSCWSGKPMDRPTFAQLKTMFEEEYKKVAGIIM